jgi:uncharacterized protein
MKIKEHIPVRTCISCGTKRPKGLLTRLAADNENCLIKDESARIMGRGVYVCNELPCLERLIHNKHLKRYFRTDRTISVCQEICSVIPVEPDR